MGANDLRVLILLVRWRHYDTYQRLGVEFEVHASTIMRICYQIQETLDQSKQFTLPGLDPNDTNDSNAVVQLAIDATECEIERPLNESQKKKRRQGKQKSNVQATDTQQEDKNEHKDDKKNSK